MEEIKSGYTRVSEILSSLRDRSFIHREVLETKGRIGTEVHHNIHKDFLGEFPIFEKFPCLHATSGAILKDKQGNDRLELRGEGYFESYLKWKEKEKPNYSLMETRFYDDELMITGQIDAIMGDVIVDFKCSHTADQEIWSMQAHYYHYLMKNPPGNHFIWLQLSKEGRFPLVHKIEYDENVLSRCIHEAIVFSERKKDALLLP